MARLGTLFCALLVALFVAVDARSYVGVYDHNYIYSDNKDNITNASIVGIFTEGLNFGVSIVRSFGLIKPLAAV